MNLEIDNLLNFSEIYSENYNLIKKCINTFSFNQPFYFLFSHQKIVIKKINEEIIIKKDNYLYLKKKKLKFYSNSRDMFEKYLETHVNKNMNEFLYSNDFYYYLCKFYYKNKTFINDCINEGYTVIQSNIENGILLKHPNENFLISIKNGNIVYFL